MTTLTLDIDNTPRMGLAECKANLSGVIANAEERDESLVVMRYGKPAALIVPFPKAKQARPLRGRGVLAEFADAEKRGLESSAFADAMVAKHVRY